MAGILIDRNVLLDLMTEDKVWSSWSMAAVDRAADHAGIGDQTPTSSSA